MPAHSIYKRKNGRRKRQFQGSSFKVFGAAILTSGKPNSASSAAWARHGGNETFAPVYRSQALRGFRRDTVMNFRRARGRLLGLHLSRMSRSARIGQHMFQSEQSECSLTPRSSGAPTAGHQGPACGTPYIFTARALVACRWLPLSSNVRQHGGSRAARQQHQRLRRGLNSHEGAMPREECAPFILNQGRKTCQHVSTKITWPREGFPTFAASSGAR
jgi:hypothetical protein